MTRQGRINGEAKVGVGVGEVRGYLLSGGEPSLLARAVPLTPGRAVLRGRKRLAQRGALPSPKREAFAFSYSALHT